MYPLTTPDLAALGAVYSLVYTPEPSNPFAWTVFGTFRRVVIRWQPTMPHLYEVKLLDAHDTEATHRAEITFERGESRDAEDRLLRLLGWAAERGFGHRGEA